ncbi:helix-turn-helix domain-containing protein [Nocardia sp. SYP-A9097]|uniref:AraC family transcriptional regulator n=1 Tax=Nocardia sp. SYP-A9097 TaxID=2663237 RepID=UPI002814BFE4|nr:helix-turn-helix domain-containing protein [Nocardia sp. SYP-A9097]
MSQGYRERPSRLPGAVVWTRDMTVDVATPVLPDGCMDLLWINGRLAIAGPDTRAYHPTADRPARVTGIRFFPGVAPTLLGVPAHALLDGRPDLADVWTLAETRRAMRLFESAPSPTAGLEAIAHWRTASADPVDLIVSRIVTELRSGTTTVATLAADLGLGPRRLHRISLTAFGYGPKILARILRMQRALALARAGTPLAETAAITGYSDQPHLSREIRDFTGLSLTELLGP